MDFFQQQDNARRHTKWLMVYFITAVGAMILVIYTACALILTGLQSPGSHHPRYEDTDYNSAGPQNAQLWNPELFLGVSGVVLAVIVIGSAGKTMELSRGGSAVAAMFGGRLVNPSTIDPNERKLLNVVEEMSIASGVPMPQVFVLDQEEGINAFAAGHATSDAAITVTGGAMRMLTRDELQGVIGHEFSHILNGDMKLNIRLIGMVFGLVCLTVIGRILLRMGGDRKEKNPLPWLGLVLIVVGAIGVFFGRLIQAAVSRQREFLADASSVQFTRNPSGLSGALQKIGSSSYGSRLESPHAEQVSHMFFGNGLGDPWFNLMATHPPIPDRIKAIDPAWDGKFAPLTEEMIPAIQRAAVSEMNAGRGKAPLPDVMGTLLAGAVLSGGHVPAQPAVQSNTIMGNVGQVTTAHLTYAAELRDSIPQKVREAAREPLGAVALIYGLLMGADGAQRQAMLKDFSAKVAQPVYDETVRLLPQIADIAARAKLALANLALPGLRQLSARQIDEFNQTIQFLIEHDNQVDLFEYCLQKMVRRNLASQFAAADKSVIQFYSTKPLLPDCTVLLSAIAHAGQDTDEEAKKAFDHGSPYLRVPGGVITLLPSSACGLEQIDAALNRIAQAAPQIKKNVLEACAQTVAADGVVKEAEAELLRAVADTLDCPIPPFVQME